MDEEIVDIVAKYGWFGVNCCDAEPPFFHTIGLMNTFNHPEFIIFGLQSEDANALFEGLIRDLRAGQDYKIPGVYTITLDEDEQRVGLRQVHESQHIRYLSLAMEFMRFIDRSGELEVMQVYWPERAGKFPYEIDCELGDYNLQPRLDIRHELGVTPRELHRFKLLERELRRFRRLFK